MEGVDDVRAHLNALHEAVWELAAISLALRGDGGAPPEQLRAARAVLVETGLVEAGPQGARLAPALQEVAGGDEAKLAAQAATAILQAAAVLSGASAWTLQQDEALLAQGRASAQAAGAFKALVLPALEGLGDLLAGPAPVMLDVGVGVGAMAVAYCEEFDRLRVVGIDVFPRALELAHRAVRDAGLEARIELRAQDVATLEDDGAFALAWVPAPFVPEAALEAGLPRVVRSLVPGGWLVVGHGKIGRGGLADALNRLQTVAFGGTALSDEEAAARLRAVGLQAVATLPTPEGAPAITVGRKAP